MNGIRGLKFNFRVIFEGFVDVTETWWAFNILGDGETETHCFTRLNIGVLTDYNYSKVFELYVLESVKYQFFWWINSLGLILLLYELESLLESWSLQILSQWLLPITQFSDKCFIASKAVSSGL